MFNTIPFILSGWCRLFHCCRVVIVSALLILLRLYLSKCVYVCVNFYCLCPVLSVLFFLRIIQWNILVRLDISVYSSTRNTQSSCSIQWFYWEENTPKSLSYVCKLAYDNRSIFILHNYHPKCKAKAHTMFYI